MGAADFTDAWAAGGAGAGRVEDKLAVFGGGRLPGAAQDVVVMPNITERAVCEGAGALFVIGVGVPGNGVSAASDDTKLRSRGDIASHFQTADRAVAALLERGRSALPDAVFRSRTGELLRLRLSRHCHASWTGCAAADQQKRTGSWRASQKIKYQ